jgi:hypothetical protein
MPRRDAAADGMVPRRRLAVTRAAAPVDRPSMLAPLDPSVTAGGR